jgi:hypothetical protein
MLPDEPEAVLPPPSCADPVELFAEFPLPAMPADVPTVVAEPPAGATDADGDAWVRLT